MLTPLPRSPLQNGRASGAEESFPRKTRAGGYAHAVKESWSRMRAGRRTRTSPLVAARGRDDVI
eukprot:6200597-Pleurochrysis_carterae.AAC.1